MSRSGTKSFSLLWYIPLICLSLAGCGLDRRVNYQHDVEIAPSQWLTLKEERGKCWFICEWKGKKVVWPGKRNDDGESEIPVTLREHEGELYLIVLNRENMEALRYVYFKLGPSGKRFVEIPLNEFPKQIATQNMYLDPRTRYGMGNKGRIDHWDLIKKLDPENVYFNNTPTAELWIQLETGLSLQKITGLEGMDFDTRKRIIREYADKYKPIPLPTLVKEN